jgi:hypothetical protein
MIFTLVGFVVAYVVLLKSLLPYTLVSLLKIELPDYVSSSKTGQTVWAFVFCFFIILPMSLPR